MMNVVTPGVIASYSLPSFEILILDHGVGMPELDEFGDFSTLACHFSVQRTSPALSS